MTAKKATLGIVLIALGFLLLLQSLDILEFRDFWRYIFPLGLIGFGAWLIVRKRQETERAEQHRQHDQYGYTPPPPPGSSGGSQQGWGDIHVQTSDDPDPGQPAGGYTHSTGEPRVSEAPSSGGAGKLQYNKLLGDMFIDLGNQGVQDVEVSMGLGDVEIKLHGAQLGTGLNRMIISTFLGDVRILVPQGMEIFVHGSNFIGAIDVLGKNSDGFGNNIDAQTANYSSAEKRLYIAANTFLGDIRVYFV